MYRVRCHNGTCQLIDPHVENLNVNLTIMKNTRNALTFKLWSSVTFVKKKLQLKMFQNLLNKANSGITSSQHVQYIK